MEYHFDHRIRLSQESAYKSLYSWSVQEVSETGEQLGTDQIPWPWSLYFSASEVRYKKELSLERRGESEDDPTRAEEALYTESICAVLHSGFTNADGHIEREVAFSMLGTRRQIRAFSLVVRPLTEEKTEEFCSVWGCVSYTYEGDFRTETEDDIVQITVAVSARRFEELCDLVNHVRPDVFLIRLGGVAGFYSEWSPSISTSRIKVLTGGAEHRVELPPACEVEPPRLGKVGEFVLTATRLNALELKRKPDVSAEELESGESEESTTLSPAQVLSSISELTAKIHASIERLKWPLWVIVVLLLLLYLK